MPPLLYSVGVLMLILFVLFFLYGIWINTYFDRKGVKVSIKPLPIFGNFFHIFFAKEHLVETLLKVYNSSKGQRYTGFYSFLTPTIFIRDLDLIKKICVKDFDHFVDHKVFFDEEAEPLFGTNLFFLRGQKWKDMRNALSPAFTSSKIRSMFPFIAECSEKFRDHLMAVTENSNGKVEELEMKELITRCTNDIIASTAFGLKIDSFVDKKNDFFEMGKKATNFSGWQFIKFQGYALFPSFMKKMNLSLFPYDVRTFFKNLVSVSMKNREKNGIIRQDMIHLLMLAKKGSLHYDNDYTNSDDTRFSSVQGDMTKQETTKREWNEDEIVAQAVAFIVAGFGTPSSLMCFITYELAKHPEVQERLYKEIEDVYKKSNGKPSFADIQGMKYIDMVISETLRLWPPDGLLERVCVKSYKLIPQNENSTKTYNVKVNDEFVIPIFAIHHDPEYFPDPERFDPERFSDENKSNIRPFSYFPFGLGPRLCIGARFALIEAKIILFNVLANFELSVTSKTPIPFVLAKDTFNMHPENGLWLGVKRRNISNKSKH